METEHRDILVSITDLRVGFSVRDGFRRTRQIRAVDGVSLDIAEGEAVGLVGESGCGKSTFGRAILRLIEPSGGTIHYHGQSLTELSTPEMRKIRQQMQMVFQDPYSSLNPRMTAAQIVAEPLLVHKRVDKKSIGPAVNKLMEDVGLGPDLNHRYANEFSGGQRQRLALARSLALSPRFIVADEPISALDVSIQAQILNLLKRLQRERGLTYLFISHDLRAIRHIADRIVVMYLGRVVEMAAASEVFLHQLMPYTKALISAIPIADPATEKHRARIVLKGDMPSPVDPPKGCAFHTRCQYAISDCGQIRPELVEIRPRHFAACIRINMDKPDIEENARLNLGVIGQ